MGVKQLVEWTKEQAFHMEQLPDPDREPIDENAVELMRKKIELVERLEVYGRAKDIYQDFSADVARQLVVEALCAKNASDRIKAADKILDRAEGRPVTRQVNMNMTPNDFNEEELKNKTENLLIELGYIEGGNVKRLIQDQPREVREALPEPSGRKNSEGEGPA